MSEVVERMAREMFEENMTLCQPELGFKHDEHWDTTPEANRELWRKVARAGLGAMREPTAAMIEAANDVEVLGADLHDFTAHECAGPIWSAMIDEAQR